MSTFALPLTRPADDLSPRGRRALTLGVVLAHVVGAWGLMQVDAVREAVRQAAPVMVTWIAPPTPEPTPPPPPRPPVAQPAPRPKPLIAAPTAVATPAFVAPAPEPAPEPVVQAAAPVTAPPAPAAPAAAPPPAPPAPRQIPASAVQYLVPPAQVYPLASRRLQEQGTVLLRLVVDAQGLPQKVTLHKSSGHPRLDEQALQAMRAARFKPHTDNGVAVDWTAIAPLSYELE